MTSSFDIPPDFSFRIIIQNFISLNVTWESQKL